MVFATKFLHGDTRLASGYDDDLAAIKCRSAGKLCHYCGLSAVALGVAYLLLAMKEKILCWYAAFLGTALSIYIFWNVNLLMESALQIYYLMMAVYGWYRGSMAYRHQGQLSNISTWSLPIHLMAIAGVLGCSAISGYLLTENSQTAYWILSPGEIVLVYGSKKCLKLDLLVGN